MSFKKGFCFEQLVIIQEQNHSHIVSAHKKCSFYWYESLDHLFPVKCLKKYILAEKKNFSILGEHIPDVNTKNG